MQQEGDSNDIHKIIVIGDAATGKTSLIYTFLREKSPNNIVPTVAVQFSSKMVQIEGNKKVKAQIWDTAGQQAYRSLTMNHYQKANGALLVFDVTRKSTFAHLSYWLQNLRERADSNLQILLVGHKIDSSKREVTSQQAKKFAIQEQILYEQTTVTNFSSINTVFKKLLTSVVNRKKQPVNARGFEIKEQEETHCKCC